MWVPLATGGAEGYKPDKGFVVDNVFFSDKAYAPVSVEPMRYLGHIVMKKDEQGREPHGIVDPAYQIYT